MEGMIHVTWHNMMQLCFFLVTTFTVLRILSQQIEMATSPINFVVTRKAWNNPAGISDNLDAVFIYLQSGMYGYKDCN